MIDLQERSDCWRWDVHTTSWCILKNKPGPGPLHGHAACRLPSCMLIFGGESGGLATNELWRFHFGTYFRNYIILSTIQSYFVNPIRRNNNCNLINDCRSDKSTFDYVNFRNWNLGEACSSGTKASTKSGERSTRCFWTRNSWQWIRQFST